MAFVGRRLRRARSTARIDADRQARDPRARQPPLPRRRRGRRPAHRRRRPARLLPHRLPQLLRPPGRGRSRWARARIREIGGRFALAELLRNGCTTVVEHRRRRRGARARSPASSGMRAYLSPAYKSPTTPSTREGQLSLRVRRGGGHGRPRARQGLHPKRAGELRRAHPGDALSLPGRHLQPRPAPRHAQGRRRARASASRSTPARTSSSSTRSCAATRMTPVEYLADTGLLGPDAIVGHCIISTAHHLAALPAGRDLEILARSRRHRRPLPARLRPARQRARVVRRSTARPA